VIRFPTEGVFLVSQRLPSKTLIFIGVAALAENSEQHDCNIVCRECSLKVLSGVI
jgi:hypothetical protein